MTAWLTPPTGAAADLVANLDAMLPRLETDRLILRPARITDWPVLEPIWTTDRAEHIGGPMNGEDAWLDYNQCVASWLLRGTGPLVLTLKGDDTPLGLVLIAPEYGDPGPELGWLLTKEAEGMGYATEAASALRDWGYNMLGRGAFQSFIGKGNARSIRVAERLGATLAGTHPTDDDVLIYSYGGHA